MESTHEEKLKSCKSQHMKWLLVVLFGMIPILITGMYMCINVKDIQLLESQSGIIFTIFGICGLTCAIGMIGSTHYSNKESALIFEETLRLLDAITLKVKENKK